jgi:hypothetical protein
MLARKPVMLDVVTIIEERNVVEEPIVTCCASCMLEVTVQRAQTETERITGKVNKYEETRSRV